MIGSEKFRRALDYWRYGRIFFESFFQKIAHNRPVPAQRMLKILVKRQVALIKIAGFQALRLNAPGR